MSIIISIQTFNLNFVHSLGTFLLSNSTFNLYHDCQEEEDSPASFINKHILNVYHRFHSVTCQVEIFTQLAVY